MIYHLLMENKKHLVGISGCFVPREELMKKSKYGYPKKIISIVKGNSNDLVDKIQKLYEQHGKENVIVEYREDKKALSNEQRQMLGDKYVSKKQRELNIAYKSFYSGPKETSSSMMNAI